MARWPSVARTHFQLEKGRGAWIQVVSGKLAVNSIHLTSGDGAAVSDEPKLDFQVFEKSEVLLFDLV